MIEEHTSPQQPAYEAPAIVYEAPIEVSASPLAPADLAKLLDP